MTRFVEGEERTQGVLLPEFLDDYGAEDNPVRVIDVFVDELDLEGLGFEGVVPEATGRPAYHPATIVKSPAFTCRSPPSFFPAFTRSAATPLPGYSWA